MYYRLVDGKNCADKEQLFLSHINGNVDGNRIYYPNVEQMNFENIPGAPIGYWCSKKFIYNFSATPCSKIADFKSGMSTTDNERFLRSWYEVNFFNIGFKVNSIDETITRKEKWYPYNKGGQFRKWFGNRELVVNWKNNGGQVLNRSAKI